MELKKLKLFRKSVFVILFILYIPVLLLAYDFGLTLSDTTEYGKDDSVEFDQYNTAALWFSHKIADSYFLYVSGTYDFTYSWTEAGTSMIPFQFDLGLSYLTGVTKFASSALEWNLGRIVLSDISGKVMSGNVDGITTDFYVNKLKIGFGAYYSGYVVKGNSDVSVSTLDAQDSVDDTVIYAPKRVIYNVKFGLIEGFFGQDIDLEIVGQNDLRSDVTAEDLIDSYYATIALSGNLFPLTSYYLGSTTELENNDGISFAEMAFSNITVYIPWKSMNISWDSLYSSSIGSDSDGFLPISSYSVSTIQSDIIAGNVMCTSLDVSFDPLNWLTTGINAGSFFRTSDAYMSVSWFDSYLAEDYLGTEGFLYLDMQLTSEFEISCTGGIFWANINATDSDVTNPLYLASISASLKI